MRDIAVIIPLFNGAKWIRFTLESVLAQTCIPAEIIVVDNNSTDSSVEIVSSFPNIKLINNPIQGANFSRQCGFQASRASLIAYLDQDDIWHPDHLKNLSCLLEQYSDYPAAVASILSFSSSRNLRFPHPQLKEFDYNPWSIFPTNQIATPSSVLIRRTAIEAIGGWPTQFDFCGDIYTWLRLSVNHPFIQNKGITVAYRRHDHSQSATSLANNIHKCFNSLFIVLKDALTYYPASSNQDYYQLEKRLHILSAMSDILSSVIDFDEAKLIQSIIVFEKRLSVEKDAFVGSMCGLLIWFLYGQLASEPFLLSRLLESWPQEATRTHKAFQARIASSRLLPKRLLSEPLNKQLWQLLLQSSDKIMPKLSLYRQ